MWNKRGKLHLFHKALIASALSLALGLQAFSPSAQADSLSDLQKQYAALQQQQQQLDKQLDSQQKAAQDSQAQLSSLSSQISLTEQQLSNLNTQVSQAAEDIRRHETDIQNTQKQIDHQISLLKARVRALYTSGNEGFLEVLFSSSSMTDFLNREQMLKAISKHDGEIIANLNVEQQKLKSEQASLKTKQNALLSAENQITAKQNALNAEKTAQAQAASAAQSAVQNTQQQQASVKSQLISTAYAEQAALARAKASAAASSENETGTISVGSSLLTSAVLALKPTVAQYAAQYGMSDYVNLILAVIQQESGGNVTDVMQSGGSSVEDSIDKGVQELKQDLDMAGCTGPSDIPAIEIALQGYNFGSGYIKQAGGKYDLNNVKNFSLVWAQKEGWSGYGDIYYVPHVLRYYSV